MFGNDYIHGYEISGYILHLTCNSSYIDFGGQHRCQYIFKSAEDIINSLSAFQFVKEYGTELYYSKEYTLEMADKQFNFLSKWTP